MRSRFSFVALAAGILAAPAFAQNDAPSGQWAGVVVRNGARAPVSLHLSERNDMWRGRLQVDGASSPLGSVPRIIKFELRDLSPKLHLVGVR